jgi:hypothetical protein
MRLRSAFEGSLSESERRVAVACDMPPTRNGIKRREKKKKRSKRRR